MKVQGKALIDLGLPILAAACLGSIAHAQIDPVNGYQCNAGDFVLTNNLSLVIDETNVTCALPVEMAQWFDLSADPTFAGQYATLKCVDFSMWGTNNTADQLITVRVFQDLTPSSSDGGPFSCDSQVVGYDGANEPGPDLASAVLLAEEETFIPIGVNPPSGPRLDGDFSVEFPGSFGGGILLEPDIAFFVVVAHAGEAITRFGGNSDGEVGDSTGGSSGGPEQTWVRPFNCTVGGGACSQTGDWQKAVLYYPDNLDIVMQVHLDLNDTRCPPIHCNICSADLTGGFEGQPDRTVNVSDLLFLLADWGNHGFPRHDADLEWEADVNCMCQLVGNGTVNVTDLLNLLGQWGPCFNPNESCESAISNGNFTAQVGEGDYFYRINGLLDGPSRPSTNDFNDILSGPTECGWNDFGPGGLPGGFQYGDTFGINPLNPEQGGGDVWFIYTANCSGPVTISTQTECAGDRIRDTIMEIYPGQAFCPTDWKQLISCDDQSAPGCGDHAQIELEVQPGDSYFIRIGGWMGEQGTGILSITPRSEGTPDCNANGNRDAFDICTGLSGDIHNNSVPDECDARGDFNGDGFVNVTDLIALLAAWGACPICPEDTNLDDTVNVTDLLTLLANWG